MSEQLMQPPAIFIVEDELVVSEDIAGALKTLGYVVSGRAASGEEALEKIRKLQPDLVLMDIMLAGEMDGVETASQIQALYGIPVIYLTAYSDTNILNRAKVTEPYGYVLKPYNERELYSAIEMALYKSSMEKKIRKRDANLFAMSSAVEWLLRVSNLPHPSAVKNFNESDIRNVLEQIGVAMEVDSIAIFTRQTGPDGESGFGIKYEWVGPRVCSLINKPDLRYFSLDSRDLGSWQEALTRGNIVSVSTKKQEKKGEKWILDSTQTVTAELIPISVQDSLWGFMGVFTIDDRAWSADEVEVLRITANLFGAALGYR